MNWFKAKDHCEAEGGKLVEIDSPEENAALAEEIENRGLTDRNFWIGLTDRASEGDWRLASSGLEPSFKNWGLGEPNNAMGLNEDCAQFSMYYLSKTKWMDIDCNKDTTTFTRRSLHPLCEFEFEKSPTRSPLSEGI